MSVRRKQVDKDALERALAAVDDGISYREAGDKFDIPKSVLYRHHSARKKGHKILKMGRPPKIDEFQEEELVKSLVTCGQMGYPMTAFDLRCFVKYHLDCQGRSSGRFKDNIPGLRWAKKFLERNSGELSERMASNIKRARAKVNHAMVRDFFRDMLNTQKEFLLKIS